MAIRKIARLGHPILRQKARELTSEEIGLPEFGRLLADLRDTMAEHDGVGLAAPQIHESVRVAIVGFDPSNPRYSGIGEFPHTVFVNPRITVLDPTEQSNWEGCLSVPGLRGLVFRPRKIRVDYLDEHGKPASLEAEGFLATVLQHELDHLDGVLYVDRVRPVPGATPLAFLEEHRRFGA